MVAHALDEEAIFHVARKINSADARDAYLRQVCEGNEPLRARVDALLKVHEQEKSFLESPASPSRATSEEPKITESPGTVIGPYKLLEQIGEGGFGVVFMAEQHQPVRRKVALKVLKPGMDTRQVVARFEAERQALAIMDHPNIAKVFDGGSTGVGVHASACAPSSGGTDSDTLKRELQLGRPYFVMELVKGVPITEHCDQNHLTPRERLELFVSVCQAVQHAHHKGIIHRDLKPSNVLVTMHDTTPLVKVIDFGVAKALGQELTDKTLFTGFAQMIGTPMYMSPEQAGQSGLDIDTRSDIYSLGVLLYELLTGTTPFDKGRLRAATYDEIRRIIREEDPPRPSTRVSTLAQAATTLADPRRADPKRLSQELRGELDWIVMKALEKDRELRYETAKDLAMDLQRYLDDEPVHACPHSAAYRFRKFAKRHKVACSLIGLVVLFVLLLGTAAVWAVRERNRADRQRELTNERERVIQDYFRAGQLKQAYQSCMAGDVGTAREILGNIERDAGQPDRRSFLWHYIDRVCRTEPVTLAGHVGPVFRAAFLPDGKRLATAGLDKQIIIWDVATRQKLAVLQSHLRDDVDTISFSPNGTSMVAAGCDGQIEFWDFASERVRGIRQSHLKNVGAVFSPDGRIIASCGEEDDKEATVIRLWDPDAMEVTAELPSHDGSINSMAFTPDSRTLACGAGHTVTIWDLESRTARRTIRDAGVAPSLAFTSDGERLAGATGVVRIWNASTGELQEVIQQPANRSRLNCIHFSPDDSLIAGTYEDGLVRIWDVATGGQRNLLRGHDKRVWSAAFSPDGQLLATTSDDSTVKLWNVASRQEYAELPTHPEPIRDVVFSPDGSLVLLSDGHDDVLFYDTSSLARTLKELDEAAKFPVGPHSVDALGMTADGVNVLTVNGWNRSGSGLGWSWGLLVKNLETGEFRRPISGDRSPSRPLVSFSPDGQRIAIAEGRDIRVCDVSNGQQLTKTHTNVNNGNRPVFSSDGRQILIRDSQLIWNLVSGETRAAPPGGETCATFAPDGKSLAYGLGNGLVEFFDAATGELLARLLSHTRSVTAVAFSPDGLTLATGSEDHTVRIWDVRTRQELAVLESHTGPILCLAFSPDSKTLVTSALRPDGQSEVRIWPGPITNSMHNRKDVP